MEVVCSGVRCRVEVRGSVVSCTPLDEEGGEAAAVFACSEISQLLRSRRDQGSAKIVVGSKTILMRFVEPREREQFIDAVQNVYNTKGDNDQWVASTICHTAVDLGILDEAALNSIIKEEFPRGVVVVFDAIGSLVDPVTFKLRPITEQLESDILRQVPILAKIFAKHVTDEETRQRFWEAVVRKYFCFSRTFLEEEMRELETEDAAAGAASAPGAGEASLSSINVSSGRALPKAQALVPHHLSPTSAAPVTTLQPHARLFYGRQRASSGRRLREWQSEAQRPPAYLPVRRPPPVLRTLPKESSSREVLELLKKFWSGDATQKRALRPKLKSVKCPSNSVLQRRCVARAREFLEEEAEEGDAEKKDD